MRAGSTYYSHVISSAGLMERRRADFAYRQKYNRYGRVMSNSRIGPIEDIDEDGASL